LHRALTGAISWQTRNETPIRKALTSPRIAPRWVAALLALGAVVIVEGDERPEEILLEALLQQGGKRNAITLHVPRSRPGRKWGEAHVARTPADEPIVAAVAAVEMEGTIVRQARVALTGVWSKPAWLAEAASQLTGHLLDEDNIRAVAQAVEKQVTPKGDFLGSEEYRRAMAGVLTRRALERCLHQENGDE
jgi:CO/xanthine dehydrogenase FAD-binding subunit